MHIAITETDSYDQNSTYQGHFKLEEACTTTSCIMATQDHAAASLHEHLQRVPFQFPQPAQAEPLRPPKIPNDSK